ncbi:uncharacterized protein LOC115929668 isoform X2 [Strongylocentrotus purpuratus]|uniref:C2H2-type domain-containing protein n=1 Tax=Strongylocentrotus purpuratus TaxID=7668 RepID=A0A7M7PQK3_STRPU|nr:uncharacterized protein LOC115929668 isoform X2 [Strongylocentrotus purpuratus]
MIDVEGLGPEIEEPITERPEEVKKYACPTCGKMFSYSCNRFRHQKNIHKKMEICKVEGCSFQCTSKRKLNAHEEFLHSKVPDKEILKFVNLEEFYTWKLREEVQNFVCYTKTRGDIKMVNSTHRHYLCALSRRVGLKKISGGKKEKYCPARLLLKESNEDGSIQVTHYRAHSHPLSFSGSQHLPMPESLRHEIKERLKAGLSPEEIIRELQKKHKSELAIAIGVYNRLQNVTKSHVSVIQRMMIKKGVLKKVIPKKISGTTEEERRTTEAATGVTGVQEFKHMNMGEEFVVFDGEVQEEMEVVVVDLPEEPSNVPDAQVLIPEPILSTPKMKPKKSKQRKSPVHATTQLINPVTINPEEYMNNVYDTFNKVKVLLCSGQVKRTDLSQIHENLQEIMNIFKDDVYVDGIV